MKKITTKQKVNIVGIGIIASILVFLLAYTFYARFLVILCERGDNLGLLFLVVTLELISFVSSYLISVWKTDDLPEVIVIKSAGISFGVNLLLICGLSYVSLFILYPELFSELYLFEYFLVFPTVLLDFSIYVLGHPIYLFIMSIITYYLLFIIILDYEIQKEVKKRG